MDKLHIFRYIEELDAFVIAEEYREIADDLGLTEWHPAVWIGRLFVMDNDFDEHWFDNWDEREVLTESAARLGINSDELMIVNPERFQDGKDGPCHTPEFRKRFWTDVLQSLELSLDLMFDEARIMNEWTKQSFPDEYIEDLEERIRKINER
jgi:hypothetical protein